ncbi:MAG: ABC transporter ATP-binding protein [Spirochaetes bacterium]|nr:ABC transporter ATP-binding protein [Spirochaetota bacterium]
MHKQGPLDTLKAFGDVDKGKIKGKTLFKLLSFSKPYFKQMSAAFIFMIISTGSVLLTPYMTKIIIDQHIIKGNINGLFSAGLILFVIILIGFLSARYQYYILAWTGQKILNSLRNKLFSHLQALSVSYNDNHIIGVTISRVTSDVSVINNLLTEGVVTIFGDLLIIIGTVTIMLSMDLKLSLISYIVIPFMLLAAYIFSHHAKKAFRDTRESIGEVIGNLSENLSGIRVTQAFNQEQNTHKRFSSKNKRNRDANIKAVSMTFMFMPAVDFLSILAVCMVVASGVFMISKGMVTIGVVVAFISYVNRFFIPIRDLTQVYATLQAASAGGEKIFELLKIKPEVKDKPDPVIIKKIKGNIEIKNLDFEYKKDIKVLNNINIKVKSQTTAAIVGPTGSGKSTIINLLCRFYNVEDKSIFIDGIDINDISLKSLHDNMSYVSQDPILFSGTVEDNIRFSKPDASIDDIIEICRKINIHDYIRRLPEGYKTKVFEGAVNLSQGQKQLLCIARAMLKKPKLLIMDEATSNIDALTESLIQNALEKLYKERTSIVIAHRLSTVKNADIIYVLKNGKIIETGRHADLLKINGMYKNLFEKQFIK